MVTAFESAAGAAVTLGRPAEALELSTRALRHLGALDGGEVPAEAYSAYATHAEALVALGRRDEGVASAHRALALALGRGDRMRINASKWRLGRLHLAVGELARAEDYLAEALGGFQEQGAMHFVAEVHAAHVSLRAAQGSYAEALAHEQAGRAISDSLTSASQAWRFADLRARHRDAELKHELELARAETQLHETAGERARVQRLALALALLAVACIVALLLTRLRARRRSERELAAMVAARTADLEARTAELDEQATELRRSNAELERFAYIASHDLKTPVRNVTSFAGLAERRLEGGDTPDPATVREVREYLALVRGYAVQMDALVTDILAFSRIDAEVSVEAAAVDLRALLGEIERREGARVRARNASLEVGWPGDGVRPGAAARPAAHPARRQRDHLQRVALPPRARDAVAAR